MLLYHIAAHVGCLVADLEGRLTWREFREWGLYFNQLNAPSEEKKSVNLLDNPDALAAALTGGG